MELEIWTWNYLYTDRKWHYIWAEEVAGISTYWEEQRTWAVALGRRSNLGVVKTIRIFKRKGKGCSRGENRREWSKNKKQPSFSGSADAFPPSFYLNLVLGSTHPALYTFSWANWSHSHSLSYHLNGETLISLHPARKTFLNSNSEFPRAADRTCPLKYHISLTDMKYFKT